MGLLEQVKAAAEQAAIRAKEAADELQTRRELGQAYGELGQKAFELLESGEVSASPLEPLADWIRGLKAQNEATESSETSEQVGATVATDGSEDAAGTTLRLVSVSRFSRCRSLRISEACW